MVGPDLTTESGDSVPAEMSSRRRRGRRTVVLLLLLSLAGPCVTSEEVNERESKQLLVRPSSQTPPRRLLLPGRGNDEISRLKQGPLTLHNGRLRPLASLGSIDRADTRADTLQFTEGRPRRRPGPGGRPALSSSSTYFPQDNVPFSYNSKPVPELFLTDFSDGDQEASASEVILDWSTKVRAKLLNTDLEFSNPNGRLANWPETNFIILLYFVSSYCFCVQENVSVQMMNIVKC